MATNTLLIVGPRNDLPLDNINLQCRVVPTFGNGVLYLWAHSLVETPLTDLFGS